MRERYAVTWLTDVPYNADLESYEPDMGNEHIRAFRTEAEALAFATNMTGIDYWGCPSVVRQELRRWNPHDGGPLITEWVTLEQVEVWP